MTDRDMTKELAEIECEAAAEAEAENARLATLMLPEGMTTGYAMHLLRAWRTAERAAKFGLAALAKAAERERALRASLDGAHADIAVAAQAHDAKVAEMEAILAGRTTPPTDAEIKASTEGRR